MKHRFFAIASAPLALGTLALAAPAVAAAPVSSSAGAGMTQSATYLPFDAHDEGAVNHGRKKYKKRKHNSYGSGDDDRYYNARYDNDRYDRDQYVRADTQIWRDRRDGRTYCRRDDGTTGLLIGAGVGGLIGNEIAGRGDRTLGTILGAAGGAILGRTIDRGNYRCR